MIVPSGINRIVYPGLWKLAPYRTDNNGGLGQPDEGSTRPFPIIKLSELFFIAAEATVKAATTSAVTGTYANEGSPRELLILLWRYSNAKNAVVIADNSAAWLLQLRLQKALTIF